MSAKHEQPAGASARWCTAATPGDLPAP